MDRVPLVRAVWEQFHAGGFERALKLVPDDVEWCLLFGNGATFKGSEELLDFLRQQPDVNGLPRGVVADAYGFEQVGNCVLVTGFVRKFHAEGGFADLQAAWVYFFEGDRLRKVTAYTSEATAAKAIADFNAASAE